jgi:hypothetical protein
MSYFQGGLRGAHQSPVVDDFRNSVVIRSGFPDHPER